MVIEILHNLPSITTLQGFVDENQILLDETFDLNNLLTFEGNDRRVQASYFNNPDEVANVNRLESPTLLKVPSERVKKDTAVVAGNLIKPNRSFRLFLSNEIKNIVTNEGYKPINKKSAIFGVNSSLFRIYNNATVWCWCKAASEGEEEGVLINLSPFVESIVVNTGQNGGNFSVKLLPVLADYERAFSYDPSKGWKVDDETLNKYVYRGTKNYLLRRHTHKQQNGKNKRAKLFFHNVISSNDVVFIQFEALEMEREQRYEDFISSRGSGNFSLYKDASELQGRNWDMIGLVDTNKASYNAQNSDMSVEILGRDLMKLLIEDGCYFFPLDFATEEGGFINASSNEGSLKRLINGELPFFNSYVDRTIEYTIRFVFNQLSNIKICSNELFKYVSEKVFKYDIRESINQEEIGVDASYDSETIYKKTLAEGIWQAVRVVIDEEIADRRIVDSSISSDSGSLLSFIQKVCQDPFVEFWGDTYGDSFYFIARKPPFTSSSIKSYINDNLVIDLLEDDIYQENLQFDDGEVYSWYRLIPKGNFFGDGGGITLSEFPAIFLQEYADIWGSRPLQVVSNYIDYQGVSGDKSVNLEYLKNQSTQDLAFIIETNCYLPFTRRGTITVKGDRRFKRGVFLRHHGTGEIFYIESVSQTYTQDMNTTDRTTVLNVVRGMVEEYIDESKEISYFNIVDLDKNIDGVSQSINFKVNKHVFDFFLNRRQYKN